MAHALGLSVGAAKLAGVAVGSVAVTRSAVLTRFDHRPPEVGLPSENPALDERGLIIKGFVERVGDPVPIVASDGSSFAAAALLADALRALLYAVTRGRRPSDPIGVAYPVHWRQPAVDALRRELVAVPEFREPMPITLVADAVAALTALQDDPGVPTRGIIAVCDFGATGTSITLADAASAFEPIAATVRDTELSGDAVDQALLTRVIADLAATGSIDLSDTSAIGSLIRLRGQCRAAKERLSTTGATSLAVDLPGRRAEVRVTRDELDEAIDRPLGNFVDVLYEELRRNGIRQKDLVAVASVGGGARIPLVATTLSEYLRVPVVTTGHPELSAAIGAGLEGLHASVEDGVTSMAASAVPPAHGFRADPPRALPPADADRVVSPIRAKPEGRQARPRPLIEFDDEGDVDDPIGFDDEELAHWYRNPFALLAVGVGAVLAATVAAAIIVLVRDDTAAPASSTVQNSRTPTTTPPPREPSPAPSPPEPSPEPAPPPPEPTESTAVIPPPAPAPLATVTEPAPRAVPTATAQPSATNSPSDSATEVPPPSPPPSETAPAPPAIPPVPEVPPVPPVPPVP